VALGWSVNVAAVGRDAGLTIVASLAVPGVVVGVRQSPDRDVVTVICSSKNNPARTSNTSSQA